MGPAITHFFSREFRVAVVISFVLLGAGTSFAYAQQYSIKIQPSGDSGDYPWQQPTGTTIACIAGIKASRPVYIEIRITIRDENFTPLGEASNQTYSQNLEVRANAEVFNLPDQTGECYVHFVVETDSSTDSAEFQIRRYTGPYISTSFDSSIISFVPHQCNHQGMLPSPALSNPAPGYSVNSPPQFAHDLGTHVRGAGVFVFLREFFPSNFPQQCIPPSP